ncbi:MAG: GspL/Epsl periplasmic domain-containing protein [Planctomycetota bacterium]|jgi:Tfp pilus assembly PilM family ATPase
MAKKSIGIDIGRSHLRAVQMTRTAEGVRVEKAFGIQTRRSTDSPVNILRALTAEHGFDRRAEVAVCLPHHAIFFADTAVDGATLDRLRAGDTSTLKDDFPIPVEKAMVQVCSVRRLADDRFSVLVAATSCDLLEEELGLLGEGKLQPTAVETPITAAHTAVAFNHPDSQRGTALILCVEQTTLNLAVIHEAHLLVVRNIPLLIPHDSGIESIARQVTDVLSREIEITWHKLFAADPDTDLRVFLVSESKTARYLAGAIEVDVNCRVTLVDPYAGMDQTAADEAPFPVCVAEGLALRKLLPEQAGAVNFLAPRQTRNGSLLTAKKELVVCGALLAATLLVWVLGLFLQLSRLESQYSQVKAQIDDVFRQTLPAEHNIVNPLAQLQQKLDSFDADTAMLTPFQPGQRTPLEILRLLSTHQPPQGQLWLSDLLVAADAVRVTGSCDSFTTFSEWQRVLETIPDLHTVDVPKQEKDAKTGNVHFALSLSSGRMVQ